MKLRKTVLLTIALLLMIVPAYAAKDALAAGGGSLKISLLKYEPVPAYQGDSLDVWVKLDNTGGDIEKDLKLEFIDNYPFTLESDSRRSHDVGALAGSYDYVAKFKVRVDSQAPAGTAYIKARYLYTKTGRSSEELMPIEIESKITTLSIEEVRSNPDKIEPGQAGEVKVIVKNLGSSMIRDVTSKLDLDISTAPVAPIGSGTELRIDSLPPGGVHEFTYNLIAKLDAEANAYKVPLVVTFRDDTGEITRYDELLGLVISSEPDLVLTVDSSDIYSDDPSGTITLKFVNKGVDEIKFVYFTLEDSDTYSLLSPTTKYYVGNIDTDDYEIEEIMVKAENGKNIELPMLVEYRDAGNKLYNREEVVTVNLVKKSEIEGKKSYTSYIVLLVIVLVLIAVYLIRRRRRK